ncbi:MAG: tRNA pseudouridine(38-40) synthase TruA [Lachnospiraceae bacterium]|nr:tRNA pseudouridine(38-40) synthase TruA [Lachnospiraceae bacterium]
MRIKLIIAYDGTDYCGWQVQNNGKSIQRAVQDAIEDLYGHEVMLTGASRTDSGVHALHQVAVFDTDKDIGIRKLPMALNVRLPEDIRIRGAEIVAGDFHPRYCDTVKTYEYRILNTDFPDPTKRLYSTFVHPKLSRESMRRALKYIEGRHDFICFCASGSNVEGSTERTITKAELLEDGDMITIRISGDGFLHNMVRIIAGTVIKIGLNAWPPEYIKAIIDSKDRRNAGPTAPAEGLTLTDIIYL